MTLINEISGIILAGGKSSRMGQDKGLMSFNNNEMVTYSIDALKPNTSEILIASNNLRYNKFGYKVLFDYFKNVGPMGGLHVGLKNTQTKLAVVLSCDTPFVSAKFVNFLISSWPKKNEPDALVPIYKSNLNPLIAIYQTKCANIIEREIKKGNYKMQSFLEQINTFKLEINDKSIGITSKTFNNLNKPNDLKN